MSVNQGGSVFAFLSMKISNLHFTQWPKETSYISWAQHCLYPSEHLTKVIYVFYHCSFLLFLFSSGTMGEGIVSTSLLMPSTMPGLDKQIVFYWVKAFRFESITRRNSHLLQKGTDKISGCIKDNDGGMKGH
jgi:hypothetical protein